MSITDKINDIKNSAIANLKDEDSYSQVSDYLNQAIKIREDAKEHNLSSTKKLIENFKEAKKSILKDINESDDATFIQKNREALKDQFLLYANKNASNDKLNLDTLFYDAVTDLYIRINRYNDRNRDGSTSERIRIDRFKPTAIKKFIDKHTKEMLGHHIKNDEVSSIIREIKPYIKEFAPLKPKFYGEYFNTYTPNGFLDLNVENKIEINKFVETTLPKRYPAINTLLTNIAPKQEEREFLLNWLSTILNTAQKTKTAIVLKGIQRTGKGVFTTKIIEHAMHSSNCFTATNQNLSDNFNNYLEDKLFITFDEVKGDYKNDKDLANKVKMIVSEDKISIRSMHTNPYMVDLYANCIFLSNEDVPLPLDQSDERFTIIETRSKTLKEAISSTMNNIDIHNFIKMIESERDEFLIHLKMCRYDKNLASSTLKNDIKNTIQDATASTGAMLKTVFRNKDIETVGEILREANEGIGFEYLTHKEIDVVTIHPTTGEKMKTRKVVAFNYNNDIMQEIFIKEFKSGIISNTSLKWFSTINKIEHILKNDKKFGSFWNLILNKPIIIKFVIDNQKQSERFRKIDEYQNITKMHFDNRLFTLSGKTAIEIVVT